VDRGKRKEKVRWTFLASSRLVGLENWSTAKALWASERCCTVGARAGQLVRNRSESWRSFLIFSSFFIKKKGHKKGPFNHK